MSAQVKFSLKGMTSAEMRAMASQLQVSLAANHETVTPEQKKADQKLIRHLNYQADKKDSGGLNRAQQKAKAAGLPVPMKSVKSKGKAVKASKTVSNQLQGLLPGFVDQVQPQVAELARDLVFQALQKSIGQEVGRVAQLILLKKKA